MGKRSSVILHSVSESSYNLALQNLSLKGKGSSQIVQKWGLNSAEIK